MRSSYIEEVETLERLTGKDLTQLKHAEIDDFVEKDLQGMEGDERLLQHAINKTVNRVHPVSYTHLDVYKRQTPYTQC